MTCIFMILCLYTFSAGNSLPWLLARVITVYPSFVLTRLVSNSLYTWGSHMPSWSSCCHLTRAGIQACSTMPGLCVLSPHTYETRTLPSKLHPWPYIFLDSLPLGTLSSISIFSPLLHLPLIHKVCPLGSISHYIATECFCVCREL